MAKISTFGGHYGPKNQNFENPCIMFLYHPKLNQHAKFHVRGLVDPDIFVDLGENWTCFLGFPIYFAKTPHHHSRSRPPNGNRWELRDE